MREAAEAASFLRGLCWESTASAETERAKTGLNFRKSKNFPGENAESVPYEQCLNFTYL